MYELKVVTHFAAAHQLKMVSRKCENLHGHNWKIEVCLSGEKLNPAGVLMDFGEIKKEIDVIMSELDHKFSNELEFFSDDHPPSSENVARFIAEVLQRKFDNDHIRISSITAWESENACAKYIV